ncbi:MAG: hypothetical protein ACKO3W_09835 [bacterium]
MSIDATNGPEFVVADDPARLREAVRRAVDYRGDVTVRCVDGREFSGYAFDARLREIEGGAPNHSAVQTLDESEELRILRADSNDRLRIRLVEISALGFTGKDAASGKTWENWLRRYAEKKLAGEAASIESEAL